MGSSPTQCVRIAPADSNALVNPRLRRQGIPEGWERIAPGRAKHAPGDRRVVMDSAPRQGGEGRGSFNPSGVVSLSHVNPGCASRPRANCSNPSGIGGTGRRAFIGIDPESDCDPDSEQDSEGNGVASINCTFQDPGEGSGSAAVWHQLHRSLGMRASEGFLEEKRRRPPRASRTALDVRTGSVAPLGLVASRVGNPG
jgi:hypothetical protein